LRKEPVGAQEARIIRSLSLQCKARLLLRANHLSSGKSIEIKRLFIVLLTLTPLTLFSLGLFSYSSFPAPLFLAVSYPPQLSFFGARCVCVYSEFKAGLVISFFAAII